MSEYLTATDLWKLYKITKARISLLEKKMNFPKPSMQKIIKAKIDGSNMFARPKKRFWMKKDVVEYFEKYPENLNSKTYIKLS